MAAPAQGAYFFFGGFVMVKDYYKVMGLTPEATGEEIKKAYRGLALQYHPDRNRGDSSCEDHLKEVNEAYQILGDEQKRRQYDLSCQQSFYRHVYYQEDLSEDLFKILRVFARGGIGMRGLGGCKGMGFGKRGCRRRKGTF
jgi:curved DNA-binding protein